MFSLKAYIPTLAQYLSVSPDALYEKQRTLIRSGLLVPVAGRGPGSGVKVSVPAVSLLTMSVLATEGLADIDPSRPTTRNWAGRVEGLFPNRLESNSDRLLKLSWLKKIWLGA